MMDDKPVYIISIAAKLACMHPQTLRIYERKGLLKPTRSKGKTRLYSEKDIEILKEIQHLTQELGLNLAGVKQIIDLKERLDETEQKINDIYDEMDSIRREAEEEIMRIIRNSSPRIVIRKNSPIMRP